MVAPVPSEGEPVNKLDVNIFDENINTAIKKIQEQ